MIKKTIAFTDFNGKPRQEDVYFNISKAEIIRWEYDEAILSEDSDKPYTGGFADRLIRLGNERRGEVIMAIVDEILEKAYGVKSEDGLHFEKSAELFQKFKSTPMYHTLFEEFTTNAGKLAQFVNQIMPPELMSAAKEAGLVNADGSVNENKLDEVRTGRASVTPTEESNQVPQAAQPTVGTPVDTEKNTGPQIQVTNSAPMPELTPEQMREAAEHYARNNNIQRNTQ